MTRSLREQIDGRCRFFNGMQHDVCEAGVRYQDVRDPDARPVRLACFKHDEFRTGSPLPPCAKREWLTPEEVDAELAESKAAVDQMMRRLSEDLCPHCGGPGKPRRMVGRCAYAPCGHRIGQVK